MTAADDWTPDDKIVDYRTLAGAAVNLFSPPDVFDRIRLLIQDPASSTEDIAEVVICDPGLTGQVLWAANRVRPSASSWIDSIADTVKLSLSGRIIRRFASLVLTQWPEVAEKFESVEYAGRLL